MHRHMTIIPAVMIFWWCLGWGMIVGLEFKISRVSLYSLRIFLSQYQDIYWLHAVLMPAELMPAEYYDNVTNFSTIMCSSIVHDKITGYRYYLKNNNFTNKYILSSSPHDGGPFWRCVFKQLPIFRYIYHICTNST